MSEPTPLILDLYRDGVLLSTQRFPPDQVITLGAGGDALVTLDEPGMAAVQLIIHRDELGLYQLVELLSTGARVNGQAGHRAWLPDGSRIEIGTLRLRFWHSEAHRPAPEPAAAARPQQPPQRRLPRALPAFLSADEGSGDLGVDRALPSVLEVVSVWGELVMDVSHFDPETPAVTLGEACGVPAGAITDPLRPLFRWSGGGFELVFHQDWPGALQSGGEPRSLRALIDDGTAQPEGDGTWSLPIGRLQRATVEIDGLTLSGRMTAHSRRVVARAPLDRPFASSLLSAAFLGALLALVIGTTPPAPAAEIYSIPDRFVEVVLRAPKAERATAPAKAPAADGGPRADREEGAAGPENDQPAPAPGARERRRQRDREVAERAGLLGYLSDQGDLDGVFSASGLGSALRSGLEGLVASAGSPLGAGGLGLRGRGPGGGGTIHGVSGPGTRGIAGGQIGYGVDGGFDGTKGTGAVVEPAPPILLGSLDSAQVDGVIKRHLSAIRYCYQRALTRSPELAGKVVVKFVIGQDGAVSTATTKSSSLGDPGVEACINGRFMTFAFPRPRGGGVVFVSYPFFFAPG